MLKWILILALNGAYEVQGTFMNETDCEKAAMAAVNDAKSQNKRLLAGCYQQVSVTSWSGR
ncbi:hypothetical protein [Pseudomonas sp. Pseu.R1]|uniref:hypothetical protein n=1 Tax=Pseudomonas sp. Pseu.R1 TaxID=3379818 RepID=UPI003B92A25B